MKARILWIEGKRADSPSFIPALRKKELTIEVAPTGNEALEKVGSFDPNLIVVNAASLRSNGKRICKTLRERCGSLPILLITLEDEGKAKDTYANTVLTLPFTTRKLINRISNYIPGDETNFLVAGPIRLDQERKQVHCLNKEARLTPRLMHLLRIFMQHPNVVLEREQLFREVWSTQYTEDTRTLDVHISWLRQAIEADPRKPQFLKTIRRLGYRLDV
jgi:DNA-binding response OmpR family regulator